MAVTRIISAIKPAELRLFGALDLRDRNGRAISELLVSPRLFGLLAYLAVSGESFVRRERLMEIFWPEHDEGHARGALRTSLYRIRSAFPDDLIETRGTEDIRLVPAQLSCDASAFAEALAEKNWEGALAAYTGRFLDAFHLDEAPSFERWLGERQSYFQSQATRCARELVTRSRAKNDVTAALHWASRWMELAPAEEMAVRELMSLYSEAGEMASALNVYENFSSYLREAYQADPSADTQGMANDLRAERATQTTAPTPAVAVLRPRIVPATSPISPVPPLSLPLKKPIAWNRVWIGIAATAVTGLAVFGWISRSPYAAASTLPRGWQMIPIAEKPIARSHPSFVYDTRTNESVVFGGRQNESALADLWRLHRANGIGEPIWERIATTVPGPGAHWIHEASYDPRTDRMIVFGGAKGYTSPCTNDVWILNGAMRGTPPLAWQQLVAPSGPAPRAELGSAYDVARNRLILFGGHDCIAPIFDDLWILTNANGVGKPEWIRVHPNSPAGSPGPRRSHSLSYDPATNRAILFGGSSDYAERHFQNDVWILTHANGLGGVAEWRLLKTLGEKPEGRVQHRAIYDAETNRLIVIGGEKRSAPGLSGTLDVWVLTGANGTTPTSSWHKVSGVREMALIAFGASFDPTSQRVLVYGGISPSGNKGVETSELRILSNPFPQ